MTEQTFGNVVWITGRLTEPSNYPKKSVVIDVNVYESEQNNLYSKRVINLYLVNDEDFSTVVDVLKQSYGENWDLYGKKVDFLGFQGVYQTYSITINQQGGINF